MSGHVADQIALPRGYKVEIDRKIAPLIQALWKLGYGTRYCCQGSDAREEPAYIVFDSVLSAALFVGVCGPASWEKKHLPREAWARWLRENHIVRFPSGDIERATRCLAATRYHLPDLIGAHQAGPEALPSAPRLCGVCHGPILSRRKDAIYCSARCRLRARNRKAL